MQHIDDKNITGLNSYKLNGQSYCRCITGSNNAMAEGKFTFLLSALHFTVADLLIPSPTRLLLEAFNHAAINAQKIFVHTSTSLFIARYSFIQLSELERRGVIEIAQFLWV